MTMLFWIWGILGLLINGLSWLTLTGSVGVGTSAYMGPEFSSGSAVWSCSVLVL